MKKHQTLKISISGVRGIVGDSFTPKVATEFAEAFGAYAGRGHVIVGRDTRPSGEMVQHAVHAGLLTVGCKPIDVGIMPTPSILVNVKAHNAVGGIAITASHNPNEWNALKFVNSEGIFLNKIQAAQLLDIYHQGDIEHVSYGDLRKIKKINNAFDVHLKLLLEFLDLELIRNAKLKVAFDCVNGAASSFTKIFLEELGCECFPLNDEPNGLFPHKPEPTPENIGQLCEHVKKSSADIGFVQDPDADRLAIINENGKPIGEDYTLVLAAKHLLERSGERKTIVGNVSITKAFDDIAAQFNANVIHTAIGEINVTEKILANNAIIGGEGNGGVIVPDIHPCRDSFIGMGIILEMMAKNKSSVSEIMNFVPRYTVAKKKFVMSASDANKLVRKLKKMKWPNDVSINTIDGVRIDWKDKWALVRPSNTEPVVRIMTEAKNKKVAEELVDYIKDIAGIDV